MKKNILSLGMLIVGLTSSFSFGQEPKAIYSEENASYTFKLHQDIANCGGLYAAIDKEAMLNANEEGEIKVSLYTLNTEGWHFQKNVIIYPEIENRRSERLNKKFEGEGVSNPRLSNSRSDSKSVLQSYTQQNITSFSLDLSDEMVQGYQISSKISWTIEETKPYRRIQRGGRSHMTPNYFGQQEEITSTYVAMN